MKFHRIVLGASVCLAACSTPKYTYHFDHYDYNAGRNTELPASETKTGESPLSLDESSLIVSSSPEIVAPSTDKKESAMASANTLREKYQAMSKTEKKEFRKELRKELKNYSRTGENKKVAGVESIKATQKFDTLVTLAIIFGAAGIVLITLAGVSNAFWIVGAVSLAIGCFFFVKWVANGNG